MWFFMMVVMMSVMMLLLVCLQFGEEIFADVIIFAFRFCFDNVMLSASLSSGEIMVIKHTRFFVFILLGGCCSSAGILELYFARKK
jgi:hypothetical protein